MSSVFGRVSGCQRPMPSLYINYYLCHCNRPVAFQCTRLCAALRSAVVRSHISSVDRFASGMRTLSHPLAQPPPPAPRLRLAPLVHQSLSRSLFAPTRVRLSRASPRIPFTRWPSEEGRREKRRFNVEPATCQLVSSRVRTGSTFPVFPDFAANVRLRARPPPPPPVMKPFARGRAKISRLTGR